MPITQKITAVLILPLASLVFGCASNPNTTGGASPTADSREDEGKAATKISMSIGEETKNFSITDKQSVDAPTGYNGTQYTVKTRTGKTFKCEILEPSGFGRAMTWGMASGASAMCADFTPGSKSQGKTNQASCNALLKAAGKCK